MKLPKLPRLAALALAGSLVAGAFASPAAAEQDGLSERQRAEIESLIATYLEENPEAVLRALETLERREQERQNAEQARTVEKLADELFHDDDDPVAGAEDAAVTVVEFFDYRCGYCRASVAPLRAQLASSDDVRIVFKELPILGADSLVGAKAALAAQRQGRYLDVHFALMEMSGPIDEAAIEALSDDLGLDHDRLVEDMEADWIVERIQRNYALARELGVSGTPAFVIGDQFVPGAIDGERLVQLIEQARRGAS